MAKRTVGTSIRAFAKMVNSSHVAVIHRIDAGQLDSRCISEDASGRYIADVEEAKRQWAENADPQYVANARGDDDIGDGGEDEPGSVKHARLRYLAAKADMAEWERDKLRGELMLRTEHKALLAAAIVPRLTKLLGVPTRARQQLPHLTMSDVETLDALQREALDGEDDSTLTGPDLDVLEAFCRDRRAEIAGEGG